VTLGLYLDHQFLPLAEEPTTRCEDRVKGAYLTKKLELPLDGSWGKKETEFYYNIQVPLIYYFVIMDCEGKLH
jgi:hypothetical protein